MNSNLAENKDIDILHVLEANENKAAKKDDNTDKQIVKLQEELSGEKSARKTERFAWILADAILVDCLILPPLSTGLCGFIMMLELILLLTLANAYELSLPTILLRKMLSKIGVE